MNQAPQPETRKFLGPGVFMLAGLALFLACAAARFSWSRGEDWKVLLFACGCAGLLVYLLGWWNAFRARHNADWFSKALNLLGGVAFVLFSALILYRMLA